MKKRRIAFLGMLTLAVACLTTSNAKAVFPPVRGDLNVDGVLNAADAAQMLRALKDKSLTIGLRPDCDFTQNGVVDETDVRSVLFYACGGVDDWDAFGERVSTGLCDESLFDHFSYTGVLDDGLGNYKSENVSITVLDGRVEEADYHLADIYVQDVTCIGNAFSQGEYKGKSETVASILDNTEGAIIAMNGDYYSLHLRGPLVRDGVLYINRITRSWDICMLLKSGELLTYRYRLLTAEAFAEMDVYQSWVFGPALLDEDGHAKTRFQSSVLPRNPRSVIGYYEPGHYAFLAVDGRSAESKGLTMERLSQLCEELGFTSAYNLDGGQSSVLQAKNGPINTPYANGRPVSDVLVVREPVLPETQAETAEDTDGTDETDSTGDTDGAESADGSGETNSTGDAEGTDDVTGTCDDMDPVVILPK